MNANDSLNLNLTGTYYEGMGEFEPSAEDQKAYQTVREIRGENALAWPPRDKSLSPPAGYFRQLHLSGPEDDNDFTTHPAYRWACQHTGLSRTDRETFACYSNNHLYDRNPGEPMLFSQPMDVIYSKFLRFGMEP